MRHMRLVQTQNNGTIGIQNITKGLIFIYAIGLHECLGIQNINCLNI